VENSPLDTPAVTRPRKRDTSNEALGRSRGGFSTKLHVSGDGKGRPLSIVVTAGQRHDSTQLEPVLDGIAVRRPSGQIRKRPSRLLGDRGFSYFGIRRILRRRKIRHVIPERKDQKRARKAKGSAGGRPPGFDREAYRRRNVVERMINRLKQYRRVATRYAKHAVRYRAMVVVAAIDLWLAA
jgi:transposase